VREKASKKILNVLFLGQINAIRGGRDLNPKKVTKRTKIRHKELLIEMCLGKGNILCLGKGNILRIITTDEHVINIKKKSATMR
jgi:hypothetical protein